VAQQPRDVLGKWLFERDYRERGLASPEQGRWEEYVPRNREEWRKEADYLLEQVAKMIEKEIEPIEVTLSGVGVVLAFLRGQLPTADPDDLVPGGASHGFDEHR
jgi:hypothetical protein